MAELANYHVCMYSTCTLGRQSVTKHLLCYLYYFYPARTNLANQPAAATPDPPPHPYSPFFTSGSQYKVAACPPDLAVCPLFFFFLPFPPATHQTTLPHPCCILHSRRKSPCASSPSPWASNAPSIFCILYFLLRRLLFLLFFFFFYHQIVLPSMLVPGKRSTLFPYAKKKWVKMRIKDECWLV
ncbi:no significant blast hit [Histoplasma capsulatum G186AR]|uniref:Uncharacterized protein n=1 Tax=Ajellomyces capsulatus TaxID=5037 RepID=A0A8H8CU78_AJECA|nr:hypothetical protein I7I52_07975 [Histoplasma capsulatum]QSS72763.1 no significant blast hit [Histoplasma capsulatum G186AR]